MRWFDGVTAVVITATIIGGAWWGASLVQPPRGGGKTLVWSEFLGQERGSSVEVAPAGGPEVVREDEASEFDYDGGVYP